MILLPVSTKLVRAPKADIEGNGPTSSFSLASNDCNATIWLIVEGIFPFRTFFFRFRLVRLVQAEISDGIDPVI